MRVAIGVVLILMGLIWIAQGFDLAFAPESFMTANRMWILWGVVAVAGGVGLLWSSRRKHSD